MASGRKSIAGLVSQHVTSALDNAHDEEDLILVTSYEKTSTGAQRIGKLDKKGDGASFIGSGYKKRIFVLRDNVLFYYKTEDDSDCTGCFILDSKCVVRTESKMAQEIIVDMSGGRTLNLRSTNARDADDWKRALHVATVRKHSCGEDIVLAWESFRHANYCNHCSSEFSVSLRKYHCRCCGRCFCVECTSNKFAMPQFQGVEQRVCDSCHHGLLRQRSEAHKLKSKLTSDAKVASTSIIWRLTTSDGCVGALARMLCSGPNGNGSASGSEVASKAPYAKTQDSDAGAGTGRL